MRQDKRQKKEIVKDVNNSSLKVVVASVGQLFRNPIANFITIFMIAISLAFPTSIYVLLKNFRSLSNSWDKGAEITVYLKQNITAKKSQALLSKLHADPNIAAIKYISPEEGLHEFQATSGFGDILAELKENPLPGVILVQPKASLKTEADVGILVDSLRKIPEVANVQLDFEWVKRLNSFTNFGIHLLTIISLMFGVGLVLIISNTVSLNTHFALHKIAMHKKNYRDPGLVNKVFLYNGIWCGLLGSLCAWMLVEIVLRWLQGSVQELASAYNHGFNLKTLVAQDVFSLIFIGTCLGLIGAWIGILKYAKSLQGRA